MISLSLRLAVTWVSAVPSSLRSRWRTSCWVMVEAPRGPAADGVEARRHDPDRVEARVLPEGAVLDGRGGVHEDGRDLVEGDDLAVELAEAGELDLLRPVVDDRLLRQLDALEQRWIRQVLGELRVRADREGGAGGSQRGQRGEQDQAHRGRDADAAACPSPGPGCRGAVVARVVAHRPRVCGGTPIRARSGVSGSAARPAPHRRPPRSADALRRRGPAAARARRRARPTARCALPDHRWCYFTASPTTPPSTGRSGRRCAPAHHPP